MLQPAKASPPLHDSKRIAIVRKRNLLACTRQHTVRFDKLSERALAELVEADGVALMADASPLLIFQVTHKILKRNSALFL